MGKEALLRAGDDANADRIAMAQPVDTHAHPWSGRIALGLLSVYYL